MKTSKKNEDDLKQNKKDKDLKNKMMTTSKKKDILKKI